MTQKEYRDSHKKEISENKARYYQNHKEELRETRKKYNKEHPETNRKYRQTPKGRMGTYLTGARNRNLEFNLDLDYFKKNWNKECVYCGDIINGIGIDRKDNDIGYTEDNVVMCCEMCNKMKLHHTAENFINQCIKITNNLK